MNHSCPGDTGSRWPYSVFDYPIEHAFSRYTEQTGIIGHSHRPFIAVMENGLARRVGGNKFTLRGNERVLVNVGSVGQIRDKNRNPSFCIYDTNRRKFTIHRFSYDIGKAEAAIQAAGMPDNNWERLGRGR